MQALMNVDPTPYVCANSATFICMDTPACDSLLNTAESYDLFHVPRSEEELENTCNPPDTSTSTAASTQESPAEQADVIPAARSIPDVGPTPSTSLRVQSALTSRAPASSTSQTLQAGSGESPADELLGGLPAGNQTDQ
ncbi:unnamed protein product, partial [Symbiodinium sp. KB8]